MPTIVCTVPKITYGKSKNHKSSFHMDKSRYHKCFLPKHQKVSQMGAPPKRPKSKIPSIFKWELHIKFQVSQMGTPYQKSKYHEWELHIKSITTGNSISKFQVSQMGTPYQKSRYHKWELHIKIPSITNGNSISKV